MKTSVVMALSFIAVALGSLFLISTLYNPSLDTVVLARDLAISIAVLFSGLAAPFLHRKFSKRNRYT